MQGAVDSPVETTTEAPIGFLRKLKGYVALTKPRVVELLLVTTAPTMILAARGIPDLWLVLITLVGGYFSAGSAHAFNSYLERDIDKKMKRTSKRPLVTGDITPRQALVFAWATAIGSTLLFGLAVNWLAAALSVAAILIYVVLYTIVLKRRTPQNIVWGGAAGCMPVLIGWAAVTGTVDWAAVVLFGVVFLWTPAHYWPLSMRFADDYNAADVPMLGAVRGNSAVGLQVVLYAWATVVCSLLLIPVAAMGVLYTAVALLSGGWFVVESHRLYAGAIRGEEVAPMRVFHASITYLTLVFVAVGIDPLLHLPIPF
jgi:protoheme IX farnesyltransferase